MSNVERRDEEAAAFAEREGLPLVAVENRYSLVRRDAEDEVLPLCERLGLGFLPFYPWRAASWREYRRGEPPPAASRFATGPEGSGPRIDG